MIKNKRNLPRYNILHLKPILHFPVLENKEFYVKDISLGGLQIFCTTEISLKSFNQVHFRLGSAQEFALNIHQVWGEEIDQLSPDYTKILKDKSEKVIYRAGLRLKFFNRDAYYSWLKLVIAIHKTQQKKNA